MTKREVFTPPVSRGDGPEDSVFSRRKTVVATGVRLFRPNVPQLSGKSFKYPKVTKDAVNFTNAYGYDDALLGDQHVLVGDRTRSLNSLLNYGYTREQVILPLGDFSALPSKAVISVYCTS